MPLTKATVTVASRIMIPSYVIFFAVVGINFAAGTFGRASSSPMLRYANELMPIQVWGGLFLGCSVLMATAMAMRHRYLYRYGLLVCALSMAAWALVAVLGIFAEPVSFSAWAWPALVCAACTATNRSLAAGEFSRRVE